MSTQFFNRLSQNYIEILNDDQYYDVTIEVGKDPNVKIFRAHMIILCYRSPFLRRTLSSNKKNNDGTLTHIKLSNISPEIFQIILKYIYGGVISLNGQEPLEILNILTTADELLLQELVGYLQDYLIKNKSEWIEQHFELTHRTSFQSNSLLELQQFCTDFIAKSPEKIFKSLDFTLLPENSLISLIKRDDLQMKEVEIWEHVLNWSLAKNPSIILDPDTWSDNDFKAIENTLQHCLPLIRFFSLSSEEFVRKVHPYKKLLKPQLYDELFKSYLDSNIEPSSNISLPRYNNNMAIDSNVVNLNIISLISRWIDKKDIENKYVYVRELYLPYEFKLLLRGSRDGFTPNKFHLLCNNKPRTVAFIKVKGTEEILGGYNPLIWESHKYGKWDKTKDSFIFSFKSKNNFKGSILSYVNHADYYAFVHYNKYGPTFGTDLLLYALDEENGLKNYDNNSCKQSCYEKKIRETEENFLIEDYEVFQIIKKRC
ncbi:hypothetical protein RclHR1_00010078 [Rhizophagus clarus]|uniref:BTB domain-containing protein n=1 Tax=Rhizophagus clarus TaxID=94130 RepID=A0A2Z6QSC3_9GLOM|nr:hypothetical protein RclHR1_00010078 [Rhizophagus clarus]GES90223.1 hypothetical protein GLOIN_2v1779084 [Rhizophagus clarus]